MASKLISILCHLHIAFFLLQFLAVAQANSNVSLGLSLYAGDNSSWASPSGDFEFGFRLLPGEQDRFLLAIWFAKIPDQTIIWSANRRSPVVKDSKLELTFTGRLLLTSPDEVLIWNSTQNVSNSMVPSHAAMLENGNFVIESTSGSSIWESFGYPTDTILPGHVLRAGDLLWSRTSENDYRPGKFELRLLWNGSLVLNQIYKTTHNPYDAFFEISNVSELVFNETGFMWLRLSNGSLMNLTPSLNSSLDLYLRATLNFDGTFSHYSHPKNWNGNASWSAVKTVPDNICFDIVGYYGSGPCGFNSYCELGPDARPKCGCPPGFSLVNPSNDYGGCKMDYTGFGQDCNGNGSVIDESRYHFKNLTGADWPLTAYEMLYPSTRHDCQVSCLHDCYCAVAIFRPPNANSSDGTCWKKRLPLSNGRFDGSAVDRIALFKLSNYNFSSAELPVPNSGKEEEEEQGKGILILSAFLATSVLFNLCSIAVISLTIFGFCHRKLRDFHRVSTARDLDMNLRCFAYRDLEEATQGFKEELGRGAFGTVCKGELVYSGYITQIAVKKLDKLVQDGEKEFKTEVKVIGQTHHKNLVRLLGYCNEGANRLLVYEFMHNGSLSSFLFGPTRLGWHQRVQIAIGIARGLMYLHEECATQIIHCDIKPQNILLDETFTAKVSDFGMAKLLINNHSRTLTGIRGTRGYVAPEWFKNTPVTVKVDIYSFGVLLLEIISCRKSLVMEKTEATVITEWAYHCFSIGRLEEVAEGDDEAKGDQRMLERMVMIALWCVQDEPELRPSMRAVTRMLEGIMVVPVPPCPFPSSSSMSQAQMMGIGLQFSDTFV